jgi:hypothetical protein
VDGEVLVGWDPGQELFLTGGPADLDLVDGVLGAESEMEAWVLLEDVGGGATHFGGLGEGAGGDADEGTEAIAVALATDEAEAEPMVIGGILVFEQDGGTAERGDDEIGGAVVVEVDDAAAAGIDTFLEERAAGVADVAKAGVAEVFEEERGHSGEGVRVTVDDDDIEVAIVVEVDEGAAPADVFMGDFEDA